VSAEALPAGLRVGQGFDIHPFAVGSGRPLVLGGVTIPGATGLAGHSDADVVAHALADALLGACGLGDLGRHFPDTDARWEGADSTVLLREVMVILGPHRRVLNADCSILCERPPLAAHLPAMEDRLGEVLAAPVSVKATRAEGLGPVGRAEGIACLAVALVAAVPPS
jgi:2-C-methyl-D-erythritol 2,4-cyclodiphosphate synthase